MSLARRTILIDLALVRELDDCQGKSTQLREPQVVWGGNGKLPKQRRHRHTANKNGMAGLSIGKKVLGGTTRPGQVGCYRRTAEGLLGSGPLKTCEKANVQQSVENRKDEIGKMILQDAQNISKQKDQ